MSASKPDQVRRRGASPRADHARVFSDFAAALAGLLVATPRPRTRRSR